MTEIEQAAEHAYTLLKEHVERYRTDIHHSSIEWRTRCRELAENLEWILFCRDHPLVLPPRRLLPPTTPPRHPPPPPLIR